MNMENTALKPNTVPNRIEDGIYFNMDEDLYHADEALGSSDLRKLLINPADYWYDSAMNVYRSVDRETPALLRGRAMHVHVLEGEAAFNKKYMRGPEHKADMTQGEKAAATKAANAHAAKWGKTVLPAETYDRIIIASAMIKKNPKLATAFEGGAPEVSIFWERDGIRRKARLDYLKPRGIGDLKSIANTREIAFPAACRNAIAQYRYEIQCAHYLEARSMITELQAYDMRKDRLSDDLDFLLKCADQKTYAFQWIFFQSEKAPVTWSRVLSPNNPIMEIAKREIEIATDNYKSYLDKFGRDMWLLIEDPQELDMSELPQWAMREI